MRRVRRVVLALVLASLVHASVRAEFTADERPPRAAMALASVQAMVVEFGAPIVLVEAERPERPDDRRAVALVLARLAECGIVTVDGEAFRARRREVADAAAVSGASRDDARASLERVDADFVLRVSVAVSDAGSSESYGMRIERRTCTLAPSLVRRSDDSALAVGAVSADGASASAQSAAETATQVAARELAISVTEAASAEWRAVRDGARPWLVEFAGQSSPEAALRALGPGDATLLEHVDRGRTLVSADAGSVERLIRGRASSVGLRRPGFVRMAEFRDGADSAPWVPGWASIAAAVTAASVVVYWTLRHSAAGTASR